MFLKKCPKMDPKLRHLPMILEFDRDMHGVSKFSSHYLNIHTENEYNSTIHD